MSPFNKKYEIKITSEDHQNIGEQVMFVLDRIGIGKPFELVKMEDLTIVRKKDKWLDEKIKTKAIQ